VNYHWQKIAAIVRLRINQHFFEEAHSEVGVVFFNLATLHIKQKEFSLGLPYLKQAHAIFLHHPNCGLTHPYTQKAIAQLKELSPHISIMEEAAAQYAQSQHTGDQAFQNKDYFYSDSTLANCITFCDRSIFFILHKEIGCDSTL
jgi:hypothetical protein